MPENTDNHIVLPDTGLDDLLATLEQENASQRQQVASLTSQLAAGGDDPIAQFLFDLTLTEVDEPGGRKRDLIAHGYAACWDYLNAQAGAEIQEHVKAHGFSRALGAAFCKFYYSPFGRSLRGEKPRKP